MRIVDLQQCKPWPLANEGTVPSAGAGFSIISHKEVGRVGHAGPHFRSQYNETSVSDSLVTHDSKLPSLRSIAPSLKNWGLE